MKRPVRGLLAALVGAVLLTTGIAATNAPAAVAEGNGVGATPALGWSSWSAVRHNPTAENIEATAKAMKDSGLAKAGYLYVNIDDFWYHCPGSQGPDVDQYGRWVTDETKFPPKGDENGIQVVADYVHSLGLKFGLYVTPGISKQAVAQNTAIEGTPYHAADIATTATEKNYNCKGMVGIDYTKPGAQDFVNSWADQFAGWGVDYVKIDGVGTPDVPDVQAWSDALKQTGRPVHLELSNSLDINNASTWAKLSNGWRTGGDIECYSCESNGSSFPLTAWSSVSSRFNQVANWAPYGSPGAFNDYDSLEVGNGSDDGLTLDERKTQMSLWSLAASPLILGTDLTRLDPTDLALLKNRSVLAVDQDAIDAKRISSDANTQVFAKTEQNGDVVVGLFNTSANGQTVSSTAAALGLPASADYSLQDLWSHRTTETSTGTVAATVPSHGVALLRIRPLHHAAALLTAPSTTVTLAGLAGASDGGQNTVTETFTNNGALAATDVRLTLTAPAGVTVEATSQTRFAAVRSGAGVSATFTVNTPASTGLFAAETVDASAAYDWLLVVPAKDTASGVLTVNQPVTAPDKTFASTTASFSQEGTRLGVRAQGSDVYGSTNQYGAIYQAGAEHDGSTTVVKIDSQTNTNAWAKAGIMVRNDITGTNTSPGFLILVEAPGKGYVIQWDANGDGQLDSNSAPNNTGIGTAAYPSWLKLVRTGTTYTGYYSTDDATWTEVAAVSVPSATATQDVGVFATAHQSGATSEVDFDGFATS
ncbi:NPCBM-associated, NEW3 domain of alpha-galactosidase [Actinacidiphila yanglinensis]|uniref:Alpha-galactosidase n=1 Tax=Actinacidiphila yanglinensis TaxID=310779 RepID=A0A1H6CJ36_9ACTN|nr:NEW3 domain-containing protein [Actinacidiphila yanglinensis]SEG72725.1 NPCBM-associated, NEW3 domain of alpha-galactosidase [Actinacidiphila yanglinensis]